MTLLSCLFQLINYVFNTRRFEVKAGCLMNELRGPNPPQFFIHDARSDLNEF